MTQQNPTSFSVAGQPSARPRWMRWLPLLLPPLYLLLVLWLQPPDHLGSYPDQAPWLGRLAYDDWDRTAMALRGLNAHLGRTAGRLDWPLDEDAEVYADSLNDRKRPLRERYCLEYPHTTLLFFRAPFLFLPALDPPPALLDGAYGNIVEHEPCNTSERPLWRHLRQVIQTYAVFMILCQLLVMVVLRTGYESDGCWVGSISLLLLPGAMYFSLNRFDIVPVLLTALSLFCLGRRWIVASGSFLAAATLVKVYPVLLVPLFLRYLGKEWRPALAWLLGYGLTAAVLLLPPLWLSGVDAVLAPYRFQLGRQPEGLTAYGHFLPMRLTENDLLGRGFRLGSLILAVGALAWRRPEDMGSLLRRSMLVLILFTTLAVFYSPQWILWFIPFLLPLASRNQTLFRLTVALDLITYFTFPVLYDETFFSWLKTEQTGQISSSSPSAWMLFTMDNLYPAVMSIVCFARFAVLAALVYVLLKFEWREPCRSAAIARVS